MFNTISKLFVALLTVTYATYYFRENMSYDGIEADAAAWSVFFSVFGVIYAIIAGFLLVEVLQRFSNLSSALEEELNALQDTRDFLIYLDRQEKTRKAIKTALTDYVRTVVDREWEEMQDLSKKTDSDTSEELHALVESVSKVKITNATDQVALQVLIEKISNITTLRTKRISLADDQLPPRLKILLTFMSSLIVVGFIALSVVNFYIHVVIVGGVTIAVLLNFLIIMDLNTPFNGVWSLSRNHFDEFLAMLTAANK